jgi:hypothetical protein
MKLVLVGIVPYPTMVIAVSLPKLLGIVLNAGLQPCRANNRELGAIFAGKSKMLEKMLVASPR